MPNMTGRRPRRATTSATAPGKLPPPHTMASGSCPVSAAAWLIGVRSLRLVGGGIGRRHVARAHQGPLAAGANEGDHLGNHRIVAELALDRIDPLRDAAIDEKQRTIGAADAVHLRLGRAAPPQADDIQSDQRAGLAEREAERDDVVAGRRHSGHHDALADAHELMDCDVTAKEREFTDTDMPAEHDVISERHVVADLAIVPDMRAHHEAAAVADAADAAAVLGAG